ncbi:MAG: helix-turn-helix transcriptional regulator [Cypionkella sp.]|uniref:helix-turn-helix transcriptional regulator n=1 Tax=Cypionkella sp. TaxID=2811411 RepID=UPI002ABC8F98|nr:helix-turn-helix transcriptional regulator [Cypionkella sp.]MDZ4310980.1 helix-turn-helix transcriptional regulator [Cypionkella sp.]
MPSSSTFQIRQSTTALLRALVSQFPAVVLVREGTKRVQQGSRQVTINTASIGVLPAHVPLTIENQPSSTGPYAASLLIPAESILESLREEALPEGDPCKTTNHDRTIGAFERAATALDDPLTPDRIRNHAVREVLLWLGEEGIGFGPARPLSLANRLRSALSKDLDAPWRSPDAARALAVSEATLRRRLAADGTSFGDLLADVRMSHALGLLQSSDLAVNRIALDVGYASASRFAIRFRARFGISPSAIRSAKPYPTAHNERIGTVKDPTSTASKG